VENDVTNRAHDCQNDNCPNEESPLSKAEGTVELLIKVLKMVVEIIVKHFQTPFCK